ncbi:MAG: hypothetical protein IKZ44_07455 [Clostridia bacterium]|nr:hypothetical protein [Clostridia bacterium]
MKRMIIVFLALSMLVACVPTPEHEFIVNKGDSTVEDKINAAPKPAEDTVQQEGAASGDPVAPVDAPTQPQLFPDRWDEDVVQINDRVSISVHADVIQKADGLYPVYRTKDVLMSEERAQEIVSKILDKPVEVYASEPTKEDYQNELKAYLDEIAAWEEWLANGKQEDRDETGFTPEKIEEKTNWFMEQIQKAPDKLEARKVSDYSGLHTRSESIYTLQCGEKAFVTLYDHRMSVYKGCEGLGQIYRESHYIEDKEEGESNAKYWKDVTMERADAEAILDAALTSLGMTEYKVSAAERACLLEHKKGGGKQYRTNGWMFVLAHNPAGYPTSNLSWHPSPYLSYGSDESFAASETIKTEDLIIFVNEDGVQSFSFSNPREIVGLSNANVELLPFEDVKRIAKNTLAMCVPYDIIGENKTNLEIYKAMLTTYTLHVKDSDEYYEMPCWALFFDGLWAGDSEAFRLKSRETNGTIHEVLLINAIDGSIIHTKYGF